MAGGLSTAPRRRSPGIAARLGLHAIGAVIVLWAVATIAFFAVRAVPGDPAETILGGPGSQASAEALDAARSAYGLDQPLGVQYLLHLRGLLTGDLGVSYALHRPVTEVIGEHLGGTLLLAVLSLVLGWLLALVVIRLASRGGRIGALLGSLLEITAAALPHFWLGAILILVFSSTLGWLPAVSTPGFAGLILPALTLAIPLAGFLGQVMREGIDTSTAAGYSQAALARGESPRGLFFRHTLRHAALPAVSLTGWAFGSLISGAVIVETVFARPGLGRTLYQAVQGRDVPVVVGIVMVVALAYVIVTIAGDLAERALDPRTVRR